MESPGYIGLSRQVALRRQLDVVANNIANMNTTGFRAERMLFETSLQRAGRRPTDKVAYTVDRSTYTDFRAGAFSQTGNPYDVAIDGDGWLTVRTPDGLRFTRDGRLKRDEAGQLVTANGHPVLDENQQPIVIAEDTTSLSFAADGVVSADNQVAARLQIVTFDNPQAVRQTGDLLFTSDEPPRPTTEARLVQGMTEQSNVQGVAEITRLMNLTRDYQSVSKMVEEGQSLLQSAINRLGKAAQ
jgi:flagellar basal-body rod protein FlgF